MNNNVRRSVTFPPRATGKVLISFIDEDTDEVYWYKVLELHHLDIEVDESYGPLMELKCSLVDRYNNEKP